jgi:hypothetical protein
MLTTLQNLYHRAHQCPFACFLKVLLSVSIIFALHIAISHQVSVSPYLFIMLVAFVGLIAALAAATHWSCRIRNTDIKVKLSN